MSVDSSVVGWRVGDVQILHLPNPHSIRLLLNPGTKVICYQRKQPQSIVNQHYQEEIHSETDEELGTRPTNHPERKGESTRVRAKQE